MKIASVNGYEIHLPTSGGKAGKGCQKTSSLQVLAPFNKDHFTIAKQFRFSMSDPESRQKAMKKLKAWIAANPIT